MSDLLLLFARAKRRPRRRRGGKGKIRKEPRRPAGAVRNILQRRKRQKAVAPRRNADKKQCSRPLTKRDESITNPRGATHIRSRRTRDPPVHLTAAGQNRRRLRPRSGAVVPPSETRRPLPPGKQSSRRPSLSGREGYSVALHAMCRYLVL